MSVGQAHRWFLFAAVALAVASVVNATRFLFAAGLVLIVLCLVRSGRLLDTRRPRPLTWVVHGATVALLLPALALGRSSPIDAVVFVIMLGVFNRYLLRGGQRDDLLVLGASAVLMAAGTTITSGVTFLLLIVAFIAVGSWALLAAQLLGMVERGAEEPAARARLLAAAARRPFPGGLARMAVSALALTVVGFALVSALPRYTFIQFLRPGFFASFAGAGDQMELRTGGAPALAGGGTQLRVEPGGGADPATLDHLYARVYVLDVFDGQTFQASGGAALYPLDRRPAEEPEVDGPTVVRVSQPRVGRDLQPVAALGRAGPARTLGRFVQRTESGTWTIGRSTAPSVSYKARLDEPWTGDFVGSRPLRAREIARLLAVPDALDPRVRELGLRLGQGKATSDEKIRAVLAHFSRGFSYSLDPLPGSSGDPLVRFLFEARRGHCELYAGAVAVLLRVAGVKARVATGYYGGSWNSLGGYLAFGAADAHAWVEAFDDEAGRWRWIDATPEDLRARERSPYAGLTDLWEAVEAYWYDNVIDFDEARRRALLGRLAERIDRLELSFTRWTGSGEGEGEAAGALRALSPRTGGLGALVLGAAAALALLLLRRRLRPQALGLALRRALAGETAPTCTLGQLLEAAPPQLRSAGSAAVALYERHRFGPEAERPSARSVHRAIRSLRAARRALPRAQRRSGAAHR